MLDSAAAQTKNHELLAYAGFITGQLESLHACHQAHIQYPGLRKLLPQNEIRRGRREGEAWLVDLRERYLQDLPRQLAAQLLGGLDLVDYRS